MAAEHRTHSRALTATEWERAAILAAFVDLPGRTGRPKKSAEVRTFESPQEFAKRGIVGLKSENTVARYVKAWMTEVGLLVVFLAGLVRRGMQDAQKLVLVDLHRATGMHALVLRIHRDSPVSRRTTSGSGSPCA